MRAPRLWHRLYAWTFRYFWRPCPRCGRMFGGHEVRGSMFDFTDYWAIPGHPFPVYRVTCCPGRFTRFPDPT